MKILLLLMMTFIPTVFFSLESQIDSLYQTLYLNTNANYQEEVTAKLLALKSTNTEEQLVIKTIQTNLLISFREGYDNSKVSSKSMQELKNIYTELTNFCTNIGYENLSPRFLTELAKLRMRVMAREQLATLIKMSKQANKDYLTVLEKDDKNFCAYLGLGQWYFFAPRIGGGSLEKSEEYYTSAEKVAIKPYQKYLVYLWRSQIYFKKKKKEKYQEELKKVDNIFPYQPYGFYKYMLERNEKRKTL